MAEARNLPQLNTLIQAYDPMQTIAEGLFCIDGDWEGTSFRRRMTICKLKSGQLLIHSPIRLKEEDYLKLEALGSVAYLIAPNAFHCSEIHYFKYRFPAAKVFASIAAVFEVTKQSKVEGVLPKDWPHPLKAEIDCMEFYGTRLLSENIFLHRASRTLIVTDLVFNMQNEPSGGEKFFFKINKIYKRFGPSRIFRYVFVNDRKKAAASLHKLLQWDFDRVILSHGKILETGGKSLLAQSFSEIGIG